MNLYFLLKYIVIIVVGCLLIAYASLNLTMSVAPSNVDELVQNYGRTYALKITPVTDTPEQTQQQIRISSTNAYILVILALISGIYLVIFGSCEIFICNLNKFLVK